MAGQNDWATRKLLCILQSHWAGHKVIGWANRRRIQVDSRRSQQEEAGFVVMKNTNSLGWAGGGMLMNEGNGWAILLL